MRPQVDVWNVSSSHQLLQLEQIAVIAEIGGGLGAQPNNILDPSHPAVAFCSTRHKPASSRRATLARS
jgi:hypothetical protein